MTGGEYVYLLRRKAGLTHDELAFRMGRSRTFVKTLEKKSYNVATAYDLAQVLGKELLPTLIAHSLQDSVKASGIDAEVTVVCK